MNIIIFMTDSYRYDNLSCYGPTRVQAPNVDRFSQQAHVFENAYLGSFPTVPNRHDIMTGRFTFVDHDWAPLPNEAVTVQQILSASGVTTQLICDTPHLIGEAFNYNRDFTGWEWIRGQETDRWKTAPVEVALPASPNKIRTPEIIKRHLRNTAWWQDEEDHFAARTVRQACEWLEQNQGQKQFLLWVDTFDPHEPWDPPQKYADLYDPGYSGETPNYPNYGYWREYLSEAELNHNRALYMGEATMVDHWFGVLLDKLDELGMSEDTAVLFMSDHGFLFGEHDLVGKSHIIDNDEISAYEAIRMYDDIRRIPLLVRMPGQTRANRIPALVQSPDLMPTILEMAGLVSTEVISGQSKTQALQCGVFYTSNWEFRPEWTHGKSLMPLIRGETDRLRDFVVSSNTLIHHTPVMAKCSVVTEDGWCLHYAGAYDAIEAGAMDGRKLLDASHARVPVEPALFDLNQDPDETRDVLNDNEALAREIHARYLAFLEEIGTLPAHLAGRRKLFGQA